MPPITGFINELIILFVDLDHNEASLKSIMEWISTSVGCTQISPDFFFIFQFIQGNHTSKLIFENEC